MNPFDYAHDLITKEKYDDDVPDRKDYNNFLSIVHCLIMVT